MGKINNGKKKNNIPNGNRRTKEEYEAIKAAQLALQGKNLDVIESIAEFLDQWLQSEKKSNRITMKEILNELNNVKGYSADDTKAVSQYSYLLMELANARNNKYVSGDRINIRMTVLSASSISITPCSSGMSSPMLKSTRSSVRAIIPRSNHYVWLHRTRTWR